MMGFGYPGVMMGGFSTFGIITWTVVMVDLVLLGIWLWKGIADKR